MIHEQISRFRDSRALTKLDARCLDPAHKAFTDGLKVFSSRLTNDHRKVALARQATCIEDVQKAVADAKSKYDTAHKNSKARTWLSKFSSRVRHYGNIMDVLVQHHPEYVSLAWGAMKLLFVVSGRV